MKRLATLGLALLLAGCANGYGKHSSRMNDVSVGMTKAQVLNAIGEPVSTSARDGVEYMNFRFYEVVFGPYVPYYVRLVGGKVDSFGRTGDFDSTNSPTTKVQIEADVRHSTEKPKFDPSKPYTVVPSEH